MGGGKVTDKWNSPSKTYNQGRAEDTGRFAPIGGSSMAANEFC